MAKCRAYILAQLATYGMNHALQGAGEALRQASNNGGMAPKKVAIETSLAPGALAMMRWLGQRLIPDRCALLLLLLLLLLLQSIRPRLYMRCADRGLLQPSYNIMTCVCLACARCAIYPHRDKLVLVRPNGIDKATGKETLPSQRITQAFITEAHNLK